jgi:hypothetical protein
MSLTSYSASKLGLYMLDGTSASLPATWYFALSTTQPTYASASNWNITEPTIGTNGYTRASVTVNSSAFVSASVQPTTYWLGQNNSTLTWGTPTGAWASSAQLKYVCWMDASSGGNCWRFETIAQPFAITGAATAPNMPAGDLLITLA